MSKKNTNLNIYSKKNINRKNKKTHKRVKYKKKRIKYTKKRVKYTNKRIKRVNNLYGGSNTTYENFPEFCNEHFQQSTIQRILWKEMPDATAPALSFLITDEQGIKEVKCILDPCGEQYVGWSKKKQMINALEKQKSFFAKFNIVYKDYALHHGAGSLSGVIYNNLFKNQAISKTGNFFVIHPVLYLLDIIYFDILSFINLEEKKTGYLSELRDIYINHLRTIFGCFFYDWEGIMGEIHELREQILKPLNDEGNPRSPTNIEIVEALIILLSSEKMRNPIIRIIVQLKVNKPFISLLPMTIHTPIVKFYGTIKDPICVCHQMGVNFDKYIHKSNIKSAKYKDVTHCNKNTTQINEQRSNVYLHQLVGSYVNCYMALKDIRRMPSGDRRVDDRWHLATKWLPFLSGGAFSGKINLNIIQMIGFYCLYKLSNGVDTENFKFFNMESYGDFSYRSVAQMIDIAEGKELKSNLKEMNENIKFLKLKKEKEKGIAMPILSEANDDDDNDDDDEINKVDKIIKEKLMKLLMEISFQYCEKYLQHFIDFYSQEFLNKFIFFKEYIFKTIEESFKSDPISSYLIAKFLEDTGEVDELKVSKFLSDFEIWK